MQRIKKRFVFLLALSMVLCLLTGCNQAKQLAALKGSWYTVRQVSAECVEAILLQIDLDEPERALVKDLQLQYCQSVFFYEDQTYTFRCEHNASKPFFRSFYQQVFQLLYENRTDLNAFYQRDFTDMTQDAFFQFYAQMYVFEDFEALLEDFCEHTKLTGGEILETGSFTIRNDMLQCVTANGVSKTIGYQLEESGNLVLSYTNGCELYTHEIPTP